MVGPCVLSTLCEREDLLMEKKHSYEKPILEKLDVVGTGAGECSNGSVPGGACESGSVPPGQCTTGGVK